MKARNEDLDRDLYPAIPGKTLEGKRFMRYPQIEDVEPYAEALEKARAKPEPEEGYG